MYSRFARKIYAATFISCRTAAKLKTNDFVRAHSRFSPNITSSSSQQSHVWRTSLLTYQSRTLCTASPSEPNIAEVYVGSKTSQVVRVKLLSFTSSCMGLAMTPHVYNQTSSVPVLIVLSSVIGFFTFATPVLLHLVAKRYVTKISYNKEEDSYCAHMLSFFCRNKQVYFKPGDAKMPSSGGMLTSVEVRGIPMLIDFSQFDKDHLKRFLGYDKPLDIKHESIAEALADSEQLKK